MSNAYEIVKKARSEYRLRAKEVIEELFEDIIYLKGDRCFADSETVIGGIASFEKKPVTFIGIQKGRGIDEGVKTNFGMPMPEGYRKAMRLMNQAEKFRRPIITFIDTPGAYPGIEAEQRGQFQAIAACLETMSALTVPVIAVVIGEGGSGGALALSVANKIFMFQNAVYSILSPEGFASILWKNAALAPKAADIMKITAKDLHEFGIVDEIIEEEDKSVNLKQLSKSIKRELDRMSLETGDRLKQERYRKFREIRG